jgi:hypothetical protein
MWSQLLRNTRHYWGIVVILAIFVAVDVFAEEKSKVRLQPVRVMPGDTLHGISEKYLQDPSRWPEIYEYNESLIKNPDLILPAMVIMVPVELVKVYLRPAKMMFVQNDVRARRKGEAEWLRAKLDMELYDEDTVRTLVRSYAKVDFPTGEVLRIGENSMVVLKPEEVGKEEIQLLQGELDSSKAKVLTVSAVVEPKVVPGSEAPQFKTRLKDDKTTEVAVYKGEVSVTGAEKKVDIGAGFGTEVKLNQKPLEPFELPPPPSGEELVRMQNEMSLPDGFTSGRIAFSFKAPEERAAGLKVSEIEGIARDEAKKQASISPIRYCHLQVARDRAFRNLVREEKGESVDWRSTGLPDGEYYWRIAFINEDGVEGAFSEVRKITVDSTPPEIEIISPQQNAVIDQSKVTVHGKTEPGVLLWVKGLPVEVGANTGKFTMRVTLEKGKNDVHFLARDRAGNESTETLRITRGKEKEESTVWKWLLPAVIIGVNAIWIGILIGTAL